MIFFIDGNVHFFSFSDYLNFLLFFRDQLVRRETLD